MNSICLVLALATSHEWKVHQMDVKSTLLHEDLQEKFTWNNFLVMFRMTPTLFVALRNLYGLKQTPQAWYAQT